jgi:acetyltransferase-like isoleucine patch superfamily enzyme
MFWPELGSFLQRGIFFVPSAMRLEKIPKLSGRFIIQGRSALVQIVGSDATLPFMETGQVTIGDNCDIAPDVTFLTGGHQMGDHSRRAGKGESYHITVGSGVWIGGRATLLLNTSIGDGSMIAACACVSKDVPADTLVAGVPAKVMKEFEDFAAVAQKK